jgi:hypothetical protein
VTNINRKIYFGQGVLQFIQSDSLLNYSGIITTVTAVNRGVFKIDLCGFANSVNLRKVMRYRADIMICERRLKIEKYNCREIFFMRIPVLLAWNEI